MKKRKQKPATLNDLPIHMRGPAQNKFGGHKTQKLRPFRGSKFGAAGDCITYTEDQKQAWISNHTTPQHV